MKSPCYLLGALIVAIAFMQSCEREVQRSSSIEIGNYSGMKVQVHDTILDGGYYDRRALIIDLDSDGQGDVEISGNVWGSPGMGHHPEADIACLNQSTFLNIIQTIDTTFLQINIDTFYSSSNQLLYINIVKNYSCDGRYGKDSIRNIRENEHINVKRKNDIISVDDIWRCDSIDLNHLGDRPWPDRIYYSGDTAVDVYSNSYSECYSFPNDQIAYVAVKKEVAGEIKLGWIKMSISSYSKVSVLESAIQN